MTIKSFWGDLLGGGVGARVRASGRCCVEMVKGGGNKCEDWYISAG